MSRTVTLVLVGPSGSVLGALPPYEVPMPWWQEVGDVVDGARQHYGVDVTVLRLLRADRPKPPGGGVAYLAELRGAGTPSMVDAPDDLREPGREPRRAPWAEPGGPAATLDWARAALAGQGRLVARAVQQRAWNLSAIWRMETVPAADGTAVLDLARGTAWVKQVPDFFAHEAAVLTWLAGAVPGVAPVLLAAGPPGRLLLAHVPGDGRYGADPAERDALAADLHRIQVAAAEPAARDRLLALGVPDARGDQLAGPARAVVAAHAGDDPVLGALAGGLAARMAAVAGCGLPDTLVHGDFHPGNAIGGRDARVIIDWGDAFIGHPAFDILRLAEGLAPDDAAGLVAAWAGRWRAAVPGCDPEHAVALLTPVAALRNAAVYAGFLDRIEPAEHPFHAADVPFWLGAARREAAG